MSIVHVAFYPSDWLAGTRGLTASETGVYITLVARMYEMAGPIERNDERLARLCGCTRAAFVRDLESLMAEGKIYETEDGLFNERARKEIEKATEISAKARSAAEARWNKKPKKNKTGKNANASAGHMPEPCQPEPEPDIEEPKGSSLAREFDALWSIVPRKVGKGQARKAFDKARKVASFTVIFSAMERHAQERAGKDPQYTPHPATWLNGERWLDEAPAPKKSILDEIDRRLANGLGLSDASGGYHSGHHALPAPVPSAGTPDGRDGACGSENDCGGGERAHLKLIKPRRFGGNGG